MTLILSPQTETRLREKADRDGQDARDVAERLINDALEWDKEDYDEAVTGIQHGLDDFSAGRTHKAADVFASIKAKHSLSD